MENADYTPMHENIKENKGNQIILLNFEDDTMRPVLKLEEKYMSIVESWYAECEILLEVEETSLYANNSQSFLGKDVDSEHHDAFVNEYMPTAIQHSLMIEKMATLEKTFNINKDGNENKNVDKNGDLHLCTFKTPPFGGVMSDKGNSYHALEKCEGVKYVKKLENLENFEENQKNAEKNAKIPTTTTNNTLKKCNMKLNNEKRFPLIVPTTNNTDGLPMFENTTLTKNCEIMPYNFVCGEWDCVDASTHQYNYLSPNFGDTCEHVYCDDKHKKCKVEEEVEKKSVFLLLLNDKFLQTLCIRNPSADMLFVAQNRPEYGFSVLLEIALDNVKDDGWIQQKFHKITFDKMEDIQEQLELLNNYMELCKPKPVNLKKENNEEILVIHYLNNNYVMNDDVEHKMKASELYNILVKELNISETLQKGFKVRLAKYLTSLGLQKKRYNDGFYYYGIVSKRINHNYNSNSTLLEDMLQTRERDNNELVKYNTYIKPIMTENAKAKAEVVVKSPPPPYPIRCKNLQIRDDVAIPNSNIVSSFNNSLFAPQTPNFTLD